MENRLCSDLTKVLVVRPCCQPRSTLWLVGGREFSAIKADCLLRREVSYDTLIADDWGGGGRS